MIGPRRAWWNRLLISVLLLIVVIHTVWGHLIPSHLLRVLRRTMGQTFKIGGARLDFPLSLVLVDVGLRAGTPDLFADSRQVVLVPRWISWSKKTVWLSTIRYEGLAIRCRRNWEGKLEVPHSPAPPAPSSTTAAPSSPTPAAAPAAAVPEAPWTVIAQTVQVVNGTLEFVDEKTPEPFRAALTEVSLMGGPLTLPSGSPRLSLAVQGRFVGHHGHAAPVYCSGWANLEPRNFEISCRLEPLPLAAFEPYYRGPIQVRVYDATVKATVKFTAKANELEGRAQVEIGNLSEADLSFLGKTLADIKTVAGERDRSLAAEVQLSGPVDQPAAWKVQLVAGNEIVQRMLRPLFDRGIENVKIKVGQQTIQVGLTPASEEAKTSIQEASKTVEESLKILAPEPAEETPPPASPPAQGGSSDAPAP